MYYPLILVPPSEEVITKKPSVVSFRRFSTTAHYHTDNRVAHWNDATVGELRGSDGKYLFPTKRKRDAWGYEEEPTPENLALEWRINGESMVDDLLGPRPLARV